MTAQRSPIGLNLIEVAAAGIAGVGMWLFHRSVLWSAVPFGSYIDATGTHPGIGATTYDQLWQLHGSSLFHQFGWPFAIFAAFAAISLVRAVRRDVRYFSVMGHLALAWPLVGNCLGILFGWFFGEFWPVGLVVAVLASTGLIGTKDRKYGDLLAILWNVAWLFLIVIYASYISQIYGD